MTTLYWLRYGFLIVLAVAAGGTAWLAIADARRRR